MSDETDPRQQWGDIPNCPGYQVNWEGEFRSLDRESSGRRYKGKPLSTRVSNRGYGLVNLVDADGKNVTRSVHSVMLETFVPGGIPEGMESRHLDDDSLHNSWRPGSEEESRSRGGNLFVGTKRDQHRDKVRNGGATPPPGPQFDCLNHERCGGKVAKDGRRCLPCVEQVGRDAADMLRSGENLLKVVRHFGYSGTRWTYQLAVRHGGYAGTEAQALTQKRSWLRRVTATVRDRSRQRDAASHPEATGERKSTGKPRPGALRAVSPQQNVGHSGHPRTLDVAERDVPDVTKRYVPYPADLVQRDRPARTAGGTTRRSR
jgi:hypothetical protein